METIKESIEVNVPVSTAYNQWTQFEEFPQFMDGVESVKQTDDSHLHWVAEIGGQRREWQAEIIEQVADEKISWRSSEGDGPNGVVTFESLGEGKTLAMVEMSYSPEGMKEQLGAKIGLGSRQVKQDLERFKDLIEALPAETGAWRGEVHAGEPKS